MMGGSGISWTICKAYAPRSRQITMPVPHHAFSSRLSTHYSYLLAANKTAVTHDLTHDRKLDTLFLCETWFTSHTAKSLLLDTALLPAVTRVIMSLAN